MAILLKKKFLIIFCFVLFSLFFSCATAPYKVKTMHDEFDGYTLHRMQANTLSGGGLLGGNIAINPQKFISKDGKIIYSLVVEYAGEGWLFIQEGESLILLVDGQRIGLKGDGSSRHRNTVYGGVVSEQALYDINREDLIKISNANEVKVKIIGSQYFAERHFSQVNFENFKKFVAQYVTK